MIEIQTQDARMRDILRLAESAAGNKSSVLITGEAGTGKSTMAKYIHERSNRAQAPFVTINCAQQPEMLLETELFGFEKGAFAGTVSEKRGKFELANGGTIVLDNVSELSTRLQAKVLKVLETNASERIGSKGGIPVDVRVVAISAKNLAESVAAQKFSENLFYKLNNVQILIPPLRERTADMKTLVSSMLSGVAARTGRKISGISEDAVEKLNSFNFTGNLRELEGILDRASLNANDSVIRSNDILTGGATDGARAQGSGAHSGTWEEQARWAPGRTLEDIEKAVILKSLNHNNGNRTHTARELGISIRTLRNKLNIYRKAGINV